MFKQALSTAVLLSICSSPIQSFGESPNYNTQVSKYGFFDFFSSNSDLKKEIKGLREKVEKLEEQQRELLTAINSAKVDFASNNDGQKKKIDDIGEIQHIMNHYGNNPDGMSALHYAIKLGDVNAINRLIANGADINTKNENFTTLTRASNCNQFESAQLLLSLGADVNLTASENSYYAIHYAAESGSGELVTLLIDSGAKLDKICPQHNEHNAKTPLHSACKIGNYEAVIALVHGGAKIDGNVSPNISVNHWHDGTPLDWAAHSLNYKNNPQHLELIKFLVESGASRRYVYQKPSCSVISGYLDSVGR